MSEKIGKFISIHGIDGTGETSTAKEIVDVLRKSGKKAINYDIYKESVKNPHATRKKEMKENWNIRRSISDIFRIHDVTGLRLKNCCYKVFM